MFAVSNEFGEFLIETKNWRGQASSFPPLGFQSFDSTAFELTSGIDFKTGSLNMWMK